MKSLVRVGLWGSLKTIIYTRFYFSFGFYDLCVRVFSFV